MIVKGNDDERGKQLFAKFLKKLRQEKNFTLTQLAELTGVSRPYLSQIESGKKGVPSIQIINSLAKVLDVSNLTLAWYAGYYTDEEYLEWTEKEDFDNHTEIDREVYHSVLVKSGEYDDFKLVHYTDIGDILQYRSGIYFDGKELNREQQKMAYQLLNTLFEKVEKTGPSEEQMKKEFKAFMESEGE